MLLDDIAEFIGLDHTKTVLKRFCTNPEPGTAFLFVGPPGTGKTTMARAVANRLKAALILVAAQKANAESINNVWADVHYYPPTGKNSWVVQVEEADQMSRAAQLALLSYLDSSANLTFDFGRAMREQAPLPVTWIFTANGTGPDSTCAPPGLEPRFLSRCLVLRFDCESTREKLPGFLQYIWKEEGGNGQVSINQIAEDSEGSVRDALQTLQLKLLDCEVKHGS